MATPPPQQPPPGWYPDPNARRLERWWDGTQWTGHERPLGVMGHQLAPMQPMSPSDEKTWAVIAHLSALAALFIGFPFLGPLIVYLVKRDESPYVRAHAAASLNFQISWAIWFIVLGIATFLLIFFIVGFLLIPVIIVAAIAWVVFIILASVKANNGEPPYNYPLTISFVS